MIHIVDDDPSVLRALRRVLTAIGHACETWESAEAFLSRPPSTTDGCVIVDLQLPGASGLDLQTCLTERDPALPVVFLTGRGDIGASVQALKGGAVDFLTKPVEPAALLVALETALERGRALREAREAEVAGGAARRSGCDGGDNQDESDARGSDRREGVARP